MIIELNDKYGIRFFEGSNKYSLIIFNYNNNGDVKMVFNSFRNLRLVLKVLLKDEKEYGDYIFLQKDFNEFLTEMGGD